MFVRAIVAISLHSIAVPGSIGAGLRKSEEFVVSRSEDAAAPLIINACRLLEVDCAGRSLPAQSRADLPTSEYSLLHALKAA